MQRVLQPIDNVESLWEMLSVGKAAQLLGVHTNTVRNWSELGILNAYRIGPRRDRRFRRADILIFLEEFGYNSVG